MTRLMSGQIIWEAISCLIAAIAIIAVRLVAHIFCHRRRYTDSHCRPLLPSFAKVAPLLEHWQPVTRMASISRLPAKVGGDASISPLVISRTNSCESCYVSRFTPLCSFS